MSNFHSKWLRVAADLLNERHEWSLANTVTEAANGYDALAVDLANEQKDRANADKVGLQYLSRIRALETALSDGLNIARSAPTSGDLAPQWRSYMNAWGDRVTALLPQSETKGDASGG